MSDEADVACIIQAEKGHERIQDTRSSFLERFRAGYILNTKEMRLHCRNVLGRMENSRLKSNPMLSSVQEPPR